MSIFILIYDKLNKDFYIYYFFVVNSQFEAVAGFCSKTKEYCPPGPGIFFYLRV